MAAPHGSRIAGRFATLIDPRVDRTEEHRRLDLLTIALRTIIAAPTRRVAYDTFGRVFAAPDPDQCGSCFLAWVQAAVVLTEDAGIARDGNAAQRAPAAIPALLLRKGGWAALALVIAFREDESRARQGRALSPRSHRRIRCDCAGNQRRGICPRTAQSLIAIPVIFLSETLEKSLLIDRVRPDLSVSITAPRGQGFQQA